ncbi:MAG: hypothetical protein V2A76_17080 [Planctomycetota bacterium]
MSPLAALILLAFPSLPTSDPVAATAWFTDAVLPETTRSAAPDEPLAPVAGTERNGVRLDRETPIDHPLLRREQGLISFWLRPDWNGDDGRSHVLLRIGDPERNGLSLEKSALGLLRLVMASPKKRTAARADVSDWRAGEWHHVALGWTSRDGRPLGLPLFVDRVAVAGPVAADNDFLDPERMADARLFIGDRTSDAEMDELILRAAFDPGVGSMVAQVYRDYFRTMPCHQIAIDPDPSEVRSDLRVLAGHAKQFGLRVTRDGRSERITDFTVRYGCWSDFDAKPFIRWSTSDEAVAEVDESGLVRGVRPGECTLAAEYRGRSASFKVEVITVDQPDLDLMYVSRLPRHSSDAPSDRPAAGDAIEWVAHVWNAGFRPAPAGVRVRLEWLAETDDDDRLAPDDPVLKSVERTVEGELAPDSQVEVHFPATWNDRPEWVRVTVDPENRVPELCEANNQRASLSTARPVWFSYDPEFFAKCRNERRINLVGSFSYADYIEAQKSCMDRMLREAVYPETSPVGVRDAFRTDLIYPQPPDGADRPEEADEALFDGGFPVGSHAELMAPDSGLIHEFGHTVLALPDLYGYGVRPENVLLEDGQGKLFAGGKSLPLIHDDTLPLSPANGVPCGEAYTPLMDFCHLWLHPAHAGQVQHFAGYRGSRFWGTAGWFIPLFGNLLLVTDVDDRPLEGAAAYVYHVTNNPALRDAGVKFFADRPKFTGHTDASGRFEFPRHTDPDWDDAATDEVEGAIEVWNPFCGAKSQVAFTPNVWEVQGLLLVRVVSGDETEFCFLSLTDFNQAFFRGERFEGHYRLRTSLRPASGKTPIVKPAVPPAIRERNLRPVAVVNVTEVTASPGEEIVLDGSKSEDPEGQPLHYRWQAGGQRGNDPTFRLRASDRTGEMTVQFHVLDGLRSSEPVEVRVNVRKPRGG